MTRQQPTRILAAVHVQDQCSVILQSIQEILPTSEVTCVNEDRVLPELGAQVYQALIISDSNGVAASFAAQLRKIASYHPDLLLIPVLAADSQTHLQTAIELDVFFYLTTPLDPVEVDLAIKRLQAKLAHSPATAVRSAAVANRRIPGFIGGGPAMSMLFELIHRVAQDDYATVLIRGESGTGKELVAKAIHAKSKRRVHNFVPVNCAAIPDDLLESELFGHLKGSFTGAGQNKTGRIQYADQGTLFLDEIGDMKPALQAKLLRVLQEKEFEPVGSLKAIPVDTRIVAATHCDLETLVRKGDFREDLYYRLSVVPIQVPPLRERCEDIPLLLDRFIEAFTVERGREKIAFSPEAVSLLMQYDWRGNVRELENLVQHMSILYSGRRIRSQDLPDKFLRSAAETPPETDGSPLPKNGLEHDMLQERADLFAAFAMPEKDQSIDLASGPVDFNDLINEFESELIVTAMKFTAGNKKEAARLLCLKRTTLLEKIKKKGLEGAWL
ncbi:MAG: sigma-54 dependent transcriptional regulator [Desulfofustis sp.]|jgi:DNA-binding NtrC family response regulator|nr:sigma-54 dependent transcriptional regulator [Desulfofustis sp.]